MSRIAEFAGSQVRPGVARSFISSITASMTQLRNMQAGMKAVFCFCTFGAALWSSLGVSVSEDFEVKDQSSADSWAKDVNPKP